MLQNEPTPQPDTDTERSGDIVDGAGATGQVSWVLTGPDGEVKESGTAYNTITTYGFDPVTGMPTGGEITSVKGRVVDVCELLAR